MLLFEILSFALLIELVQSFPVQLPHYDLLTGATKNRSYVDMDTNSYFDQTNGLLGTDKYQRYNVYHYQPYVANGFIGSRIPNVGFGFTYDQNSNTSSGDLLNGWPLVTERFAGAFISGFFDLYDKKFPTTNFPELYAKGYESVISVVPQWTDFNFKTSLNGTTYTLNPRLTNETAKIGSISDYNQELSIKNGVVTTTFKWLDTIEFKFQTLLHRSIETLGLINVEWKSYTDLVLEIEDFIDFNTSARCDFVEANTDDDGIYMIFKPSLVESVNGTIYSVLHSDSIANWNKTVSDEIVSQSSKLTLSSNQIYNLTKFVGISSTDHDATPFDTAKETALTNLNFGQLYTIHDQTWYDLIGKTRISVPSSELITLTSEASLYHLLANQRSSSTGVTSALGVSGLSSDSYAGMQFWDTDLWMIPSIIPFAPDIAKLISKYRLYTHSQALQNAQDLDKQGAVYPWTSGRYGNCTSTGPCFDYEYHINVAVTFSVWKLYLQGEIDDTYMIDEGYKLFKDASEFFIQYVNYNETLSKFTTKNLTDPDEYANQVNNGAYTNVGISQLLKWSTLLGNHLNLTVNKEWEYVAQNMYLPQSEYNVTLEYDTMNSSIEVKQADVIMITYPLDDEDGALEENFEYDRDKLLNDLYYYSEHQSAQGPAMTFPVFSMVSSKLSESGCSGTSYLYKSIEPFVRFPFGQLSEQNFDDYESNGGTHPLFPFLTGHGGVLQSVIYGLTGLKFGYELNGTTIERKLLFDPIKLPCLPGGVRVDYFQYQGVNLYVEINDENAILYHHGNINKTIIIDVNERNPHPGKFELHPNESLQFSLFAFGKSVANSITECSAKIIDSSEPIHGDVSQTINDGDNSTTWQSTNIDKSYIVFDLGDSYDDIDKGIIVWGENPARAINLYSSSSEFSINNYSSNNETRQLLSNYSIDISNEFNVKEYAKIRYDTSRNFTSFQLDEPVDGVRYVMLEMIDSYDNSEGAIIAEFNLLSK